MVVYIDLPHFFFKKKMATKKMAAKTQNWSKLIQFCILVDIDLLSGTDMIQISELSNQGGGQKQIGCQLPNWS